MKYETPRLTASTPAINAIQSVSGKGDMINLDNPFEKEAVSAYTDWE
jgi:hypothetical protein